MASSAWNHHRHGTIGDSYQIALTDGHVLHRRFDGPGGGLIFNAGVTDSKVRAIDILNGRELWTDELPAASTATPMSYVSPNQGGNT